MNRAVTLTIEGNIYEVNYPNTGEQIDIELLKAKIADGNYDMIRLSNNPLFQEQADKIDMIATFSVLIPKLKKDVNVDSLFKLTEEESDKLMEAYNNQFIPWFIEIKKAIRAPKSQLQKAESTKDQVSSNSQ